MIPLHQPLVDKLSWLKLEEHAEELSTQHLNDLFSSNKKRFDSLSASACGLTLDISKQRLTTRTFELLGGLADERQLAGWIKSLFDGDKVNCTEGRQAMHWRLRSVDPGSEVEDQLQHMGVIVDRILSGHWRGYLGDSITDVVNIGVGGSDLGPLMATRALHQCEPDKGKRPRLHFVSSMDGSHLDSLLAGLNPRATLFVVSSKSFTTIDTLTNASTARCWLERECGGSSAALMRCHFIGVSASHKKMDAWGIPASNQLFFWEWVGGRYSLWSAIGLPIALCIGMKAFREFLAGAHDMDLHFQNTPVLQNLPVMMGLVDIWNINFLGISARAVLPYDGRLQYLPAYLEQLEMESNGKSVDRAGQTVPYHTCPVIWGEVGPNAQHAFYQLLHQGTEPVSCEFVMVARRYAEKADTPDKIELEQQHALALANCLAQSRLLALGDAALGNYDNLDPHKRYRGNQPSSTLLMDALTPRALGSLIALYEHKVFVEAVIWGINPFDQWGVEMGKVIAKGMEALLCGKVDDAQLDSSSLGLADRIRKSRFDGEAS